MNSFNFKQLEILKKKFRSTRTCPEWRLTRYRQSMLPIIQEADFGKCAVRVAQQHAQHVPVKNLMERSNSDSGYEVECKGFELPIIQEAGALTKCHSEGIRPKNPLHFIKRFFAEYKFPFAGNCVKPAQNDSNFLVPQCLSNLVPFCPLSLPSPSRGEGHKTVKNLFTHSPIHLFTPKRAGLLRFARNDEKNVTNLSSYRLNDLSTSKKQAAFTLTEVLVALSIVGIIAALVLPAVISNYQTKSFNQAFQRETQTLQSTIEGLPVSENKASFFDTMMYKSTLETDETTGAANYDDSSKAFMQKYLKVSKFCGTNTDCFAEKYYEYTDGDKKVYTPDFKGACAKLKNGMSICLTPQVGTTPIEGVIDLNGAKGPNVFGKDLRTFSISAFAKNGHNQTTDTVLSYDFDPIVPEEEEEETDPCEGKTCGCGSLPDCPTCETTPESSWSEECCLANTSKITPGHHCCSFSQFSSSSYCKETPACSNPDPSDSSRCCDTASITSSSDSCCKISSIYNNNSACKEEKITLHCRSCSENPSYCNTSGGKNKGDYYCISTSSTGNSGYSFKLSWTYKGVAGDAPCACYGDPSCKVNQTSGMCTFTFLAGSNVVFDEVDGDIHVCSIYGSNGKLDNSKSCRTSSTWADYP